VLERLLRNQKSVAATNIVAYRDKKNITAEPNGPYLLIFLLENLKVTGLTELDAPFGKCN
jgi:hypothetical protein